MTTKRGSWWPIIPRLVGRRLVRMVAGGLNCRASKGLEMSGNISAIAAWVGVTLGLANLAFTASRGRPPIFMRYQKNTATDRDTLIVTVVSDQTPVFLKSLATIPKVKSLQVMLVGSTNTTMSRDHLRWLNSSQFRAYIPVGETREVHISFAKSEGPFALIARWSNFRFQLLPCSPFLITRGYVAMLRDAEPVKD